MERLLKKNRLFNSAVARLLAGLIRSVRATSTTVHEPRELIEDLRAQVPFILAMWHGQFMMLADLNTREFPVSAMVARHGDAEIMARVLAHFGISSIRGAGAGARRRNRGGAYALRAAVRALEGGTIVAMTADVPSSTPRVAGEGIVTLARLSGRPIIPIAAATSRYAVLNTWSKFTINLPFSKFALVAGEPLFVSADADATELEQARLHVERALIAVTDRAYELARSCGSYKEASARSRRAPQRYQ
jgi:3-deoxy-D-manno-octulosonic-acid transferase